MCTVWFDSVWQVPTVWRDRGWSLQVSRQDAWSQQQ